MTICPRCRKGLKDRGANRKKIVVRSRKFWPKSVYIHKVCPPADPKPPLPTSGVLTGREMIRYFEEVVKQS